MMDVKLAFDILAFVSVMVLVVMGLGVIASMMGVFNFAHGEFVMLGAYTVFVAQEAGAPSWVGIIAAPFVLAGLGLALERLVIRRWYAAPIIAMLGTFAIGLVIREVVRGLLGGHYKSIEEPLRGSFVLGGIEFSWWRTAIILIAAVVIAASWFFLTRTGTGLRIRGAIENPPLARACGISTARLYAFTFAFGAALAGLAGALIVPLYQLSADIGTRFLVQSFLSVMLGGVGSFTGPVLGASAVGAMAAGQPWAVVPVLADPLVFVIALTIVRFRPQGLLSHGRL